MLLFYTPKIDFTTAQLKDMLILQAKANDVMSDAWRTSCNCTIPYYRAAVVEMFEAIGHIGFKWWKKEATNVNQTEMELIDGLHFALSHELRLTYTLQADQEPNAVLAIDEIAQITAESLVQEQHEAFSIDYVGRNASEDAYEKIEVVDGEVDITKFDMKDLLELFIHNTLGAGEPDWAVLMALFDAAGMTADTVYEIYVNKNLLNIFRTSNGQRAGTYLKMWGGREDNEFIADYRNKAIAENRTVDVEELLEYLQTTYTHHVENNTAVAA